MEQVMHIKHEVFTTVGSIIRKKNIIVFFYFFFYCVTRCHLWKGSPSAWHPALLQDVGHGGQAAAQPHAGAPQDGARCCAVLAVVKHVWASQPPLRRGGDY